MFGDGAGGAFPRELAWWVMGVMYASLGHASGRGNNASGTFSKGLACLGEGISVWEPRSCLRSSSHERACDAHCGGAFVGCFSSHVWSTGGRSLAVREEHDTSDRNPDTRAAMLSTQPVPVLASWCCVATSQRVTVIPKAYGALGVLLQPDLLPCP